MTPIEFKSWFEGFTEFLEGPPSKKQWDRIKARISEMKAPVPNYYYPYPQYGYIGMVNAQTTTGYTLNTGTALPCMTHETTPNQHYQQSSISSAFTLGKTEAGNG